MPVDPAHGEDIPTGRRLAAVLAGWFSIAVKGALAGLKRALSIGSAVGAFFSPPVNTAKILDDVTNVLTAEYSRGWLRSAKRRRAESLAPFEPPLGPTTRIPRIDTRIEDVLTKPVLLPKPPPIPPIRPPSIAAFPSPRPRVVADFNLLLPEVQQHVREYSFNLIRNVSQTTIELTRKAIYDAVAAGESYHDAAKRLEHIYSPKRARMIAQTEVSNALHSGQYHAGQAAGGWGVEWLISSDACEKICKPLGGQQRKYGEPFLPGIYHPTAHPWCRCAMRDIFRDPSGRTV